MPPANQTLRSPTGIGAPVRRVEDARLLAGNGRYVDDLSLPKMAHAVVLRSPYAHAVIRAIDADTAREMPGVLLILTGADMVADGLGPLPCQVFPGPRNDGMPPPHCILAVDHVRHVGDRVALIVAETVHQARDAAEAIIVDYGPLPAVIDPAAALAENAPKVWEQAANNLAFQIGKGDAASTDNAFRQAAHVVTIEHRYPRIAGTPLEPRTSIGDHSPWDGRYTLYTSTQQPHRIREVVAREVLKLPETDLRVVTRDVGGGFGTKGTTYPEDALVVWAAGKLKRPVKWTGERAEALAADIAGRDHVERGELALDENGLITGCRLTSDVNLGAYLAYSAGVPAINVANLTGGYRIPAYHGVVRAAFTNTAPVGPYRGTGRPEANFMMERLLDEAAIATGLGRDEIRRRNLIPASAMPSNMPGGSSIENGDFHHILDRALELADWSGFPERRAGSEQSGRRRGIGLGFYAILAGSAIQSERMEIRVDRDGTILLLAGTQASGQGHETVYAQMLSEWLGQPFENVRVLEGDTDQVMFGRGSFAARSMMLGGTALRAATDALIDKGKKFAGLLLEAAEADIEFADGTFRIAGSDRAVSFTQVAERSYAVSGNPMEFGIGLGGDGGGLVDPTAPNGCLVCEIEVDPDTGQVSVENIVSVDDVGVVLNPLTLAGQIHGAIGQAAGEALLEEVGYDPSDGQLITGSFMDYGIPRADTLCNIVNEFVEVPATTNPLGVKGASELGSSGFPAAVANAVIDALRPLGVDNLSLPMTPQKVWQAIQGARRI